MRGKGTVSRTSGSFVGITPAYAGKSLFCFCCRSLFWDHPRLCGEKRSFRAVVCKRTGSPPPMRGKATGRKSTESVNRITPAYAGKSREPRQADTCEWDHPRLCGEKQFSTAQTTITVGSPPPMRGKGKVRYLRRCTERITPAYAGKSIFCRLTFDLF